MTDDDLQRVTLGEVKPLETRILQVCYNPVLPKILARDSSEFLVVGPPGFTIPWTRTFLAQEITIDPLFYFADGSFVGPRAQ